MSGFLSFMLLYQNLVESCKSRYSVLPFEVCLTLYKGENIGEKITAYAVARGSDPLEGELLLGVGHICQGNGLEVELIFAVLCLNSLKGDHLVGCTLAGTLNSLASC